MTASNGRLFPFIIERRPPPEIWHMAQIKKIWWLSLVYETSFAGGCQAWDICDISIGWLSYGRAGGGDEEDWEESLNEDEGWLLWVLGCLWLEKLNPIIEMLSVGRSWRKDSVSFVSVELSKAFSNENILMLEVFCPGITQYDSIRFVPNAWGLLSWNNSIWFYLFSSRLERFLEFMS